MGFKFIKPIEEDYLRGLYAGLIAGVIKDIPDLLIVDLFHIKRLGFWDYIGEIFFSKIPQSFVEHLVSFILEVSFSLGLGIVFSVIVTKLFPTKHCLIRGAIYGSACWFTLNSIVKVYHISPLIIKGDLLTPLATLAFSAGYGLLLGYFDRLLSPQSRSTKVW